jgi:hypothetical protein
VKTSLYYLCDGDGPVRYVGKTSAPLAARLSQHKSHSRRERNHRAFWVRSAKDLRIELIDVVEGDGAREEVTLIAALKSLGASLVNGTSGGEGTPGHQKSAETRLKLAEAGRRRRHSEQTRKKMSETRKGRKASEETKAKISEARRKQPAPSVETRRKISNTLKARRDRPGGHNS